jgi:type IX secretion system PorP/SprF family membrane protein
MKHKYIIMRMLVILILLIASKSAFSQQDPMYTQYMFNTQVINPAYAGSWESFGFLALSRLQWVGFKDAPRTNMLSIQAPTRKLKAAFGLNLVQDKVGFEKRVGLFGDYSYKISFSENTSLRMGIKAGFTNYSHNLTEHTLPDGTDFDPLFQSDVEQRFIPNFGVGFLLSSEKYYLGLSSPKLLNSTIRLSSTNYSVFSEFRHFFLIGGYVFPIAEKLKFKPSFLAKATLGIPLEVDFSASFLFNEKVWIGAMYRTGDSFGFLAQWVFDNNLRIGYSYDVTTTQLKNYHSNTHEIMISYELNFVKETIVSPRYF